MGIRDPIFSNFVRKLFRTASSSSPGYCPTSVITLEEKLHFDWIHLEIALNASCRNFSATYVTALSCDFYFITFDLTYLACSVLSLTNPPKYLCIDTIVEPWSWKSSLALAWNSSFAIRMLWDSFGSPNRKYWFHSNVASNSWSSLSALWFAQWKNWKTIRHVASTGTGIVHHN